MKECYFCARPFGFNEDHAWYDFRGNKYNSCDKVTSDMSVKRVCSVCDSDVKKKDQVIHE